MSKVWTALRERMEERMLENGLRVGVTGVVTDFVNVWEQPQNLEQLRITDAFEAAERFGLFVTGGSDFHGRYSSAPCLGTAYLAPQEATERLNALFEIEQTLQ